MSSSSHLEHALHAFAIRPNGEFQEAPVPELLSHYTLSPLSAGCFSRVFRIEGQPWVVKEGRWDKDVQPGSPINLNIPANLVETFAKIIFPSLLPTVDSTKIQYADYLSMAKYLGYMPESEAHIVGENLIRAQRTIRNVLEDSSLDVPLSETTKHALQREDIRTHSFLPREYLLIGPSLSPSNNKKGTFYIFQEFVEGPSLHDLPRSCMEENQRDQFLLFCYLIVRMHKDIGLLPDTRPRSPFLQWNNWLTKTDNIVAGSRGLTLVDTRWCWHTHGGVSGNGFGIAPFMLNQCKKEIQKN